MDGIDQTTLQRWFNSTSDAIRIISILSPTGVSGLEFTEQVFKRCDSKRLRSFVIFLPMFESDTMEAAEKIAKSMTEERISRGWDQEKILGNLFSRVLKLKSTAFEVYLLYSPRIVWDMIDPPAPTFWMHQLGVDSGADQDLFLDPNRFIDEVKLLIDMEDPEASENEVSRVLLRKEKS